jgi:hypothetical protein
MHLRGIIDFSHHNIKTDFNIIEWENNTKMARPSFDESF